MATEWKCIPHDSGSRKNQFARSATLDHPLKQQTISVLESKGTRPDTIRSDSGTISSSSSTLSLDPLSLALDGSDPLSQFAKQEAVALDPLSMMAAEYEPSASVPSVTSATKPKSSRKQEFHPNPDAELWSLRRGAILSKYTTSERLSIVTSFLTGSEMIKTQTTMSEKVKHRLEQLDDFDEGSVKHVQNLTQQEYVTKIEQLNQELVVAWNTDQRVRALKIAIQCAKLLADTSVMQFYPSKFVLITDILDIFGKLVFERLKNKAGYVRPGGKTPTALPDNFTPDMVPESAKETCLNWLYKTASIRELLPRFYIEVALLKCYSFLTLTEFDQALIRLTRIARGIADPLVAAYARCYLCRIGMLVTTDREFIKENLYDFLLVYHTLFTGGIRGEITRQRLSISAYLSLYTPALDWINHGIASKASDFTLDEILAKCQEKKNNGLLHASILSSFRPDFIASRALHIVDLLSSCDTEGITRAQLLRQLGSVLSATPPPPDQRKPVLNAVRRTVATLTAVAEYVNCVETWAFYTSSNFGAAEIDTFFADVINHVTLNRAFENHYQELQTIVDKTVAGFRDLEALIVLENFLPFLDLFQKESFKVDVCKNVLLAYKSSAGERPLADPVVINALMQIGKVLNDYVNALTLEDERRQISQLISFFIRQTDFGDDLEQHLSFYVDARGAFPNLEAVFVTLVNCVNRLAMLSESVSFVKACVAYNFITIPSIVTTNAKMDLYLLTGLIALRSACLGQADACFEAAIGLISELPKTIELEGKSKQTEDYLQGYVAKLLSALIIVPDSPDAPTLHLPRLLLDAIRQYPFEPNSLISACLSLLNGLAVLAQEDFPYHIDGVISNDQLYGLDPKYLAQLNLLCSQTADLILLNLKALADAKDFRSQSLLAIEFLLCIVRNSDITTERTFTLIINLWNLALKNRTCVDPRAVVRAIETVDRLRVNTDQTSEQREALENLLAKMKSKIA